MIDDPIGFRQHARRLGPAYSTRIYGCPLEPWAARPGEVPAHRAWFVGGEGGEVGALWHEGTLTLAVGREGAGWLLEGSHARALEFDDPMPAVLHNEPEDLSANIHTQLFTRRQPLAAFSYHRIVPSPGQRVLLSSGLQVEDSALAGEHTSVELLDTLAQPPRQQPKPGLFARLRRSAPRGPRGAALILECVDEPAAPGGFIPWLEHQQQRGLAFGWMGNEGGGELHTHREPRPSAAGASLPLALALVEVLRRSEPCQDGLGLDPELWEEWSEHGEREPGFCAVDEDAPHLGFWRSLELSEVSADLEGRASEYLPPGTADSRLMFQRFVPGREFVAHLRSVFVEPAAVGLYQVPNEESVVVWFAIGGVSKRSGQLELMLVERVWS